MNINIVNVFPIIDFEFYHNVHQKKLSLIKFINPFKFNNEKTPEKTAEYGLECTIFY